MNKENENSNDGLALGTILLERYQIEKEIGGGGMSNVYLAVDLWERNSFVVVKTPIAKFLNDSWVIKKFKQEAESLARLKHNGVIRLINHGLINDFFTAEPYPFVILEYIEGVTLSSLIKDLWQNQQRCANIFYQIVEAVDYAHNCQIFHRDLKPDNIMVHRAGQDDESVKLIDFGIARVLDSFFNSTKTRYEVGTPHYLSPNRLRHEPDDRADDIYALGLIAYEILTGENPVKKARNFEELMHLQENIPPLRQINNQIPVPVENEVMRALSLDKGMRPANALEFGEKLFKSLYSESTDPQPDSPPADNPPPARLNEFRIELDLTTKKSFAAGDKFLINEQYGAALDYYNNALESSPDDDLPYARRAMAHLMMKEYEQALKDCSQAIKINPANDFAYLIKGIIFRLKVKPSESEAELIKALQINPHNIEANLILGDICAAREEFDKALGFYSFICQINPGFSWAYSNRGSIFYANGEYEKAITDFTRAVELSPKSSWNHFQRAKTFQKMGKFKQAIEDLTNAIALSPEISRFYNERGKTFYLLGEISRAIEDFNQTKQLSINLKSSLNESQDMTNADKNLGLSSLTDYLKWIG